MATSNVRERKKLMKFFNSRVFAAVLAVVMICYFASSAEAVVFKHRAEHGHGHLTTIVQRYVEARQVRAVTVIVTNQPVVVRSANLKHGTRLLHSRKHALSHH